MQITGGKGVDLLLNSLNAEYIPKGLSILSEGGRFLEIGKVGIWTPEQVKAHRPDVAYYTIALDDLSKHQPQLIGELFQELLALFESGQLKPLPHKVYSIEEAVSAFRFMQQARHIGKVVIALGGEKKESETPVQIRPDAAYLVTGGTGGLGLEIARWLVQKGAGEIVLVGRHQPDATVQQRIKEWPSVRFYQADVSRFEDIQQLFASFQKENALPIGGIFHAAGVLDDGIVLQQDWDRFVKVFAPKVNGSWNIARALRNHSVDFILYFSSMASLLGSPGQGNYAAANAFMDALAHYQQSQHIRAISINWGPWANVGMAARVKGNVGGQGIKPIDPEIGVELLEHLLQRNLPQIAVLPIQWKSFLKRFEGINLPPVLNHFAGVRAAKGDTTTVQKSKFVQRLEKASPEERKEMLIQYLREQATRVLGLDPATPVDPNKPLSEMGLDSLMAIELKNTLDNAVGQKLPATVVFNYPTIDALAGYLLTEVLQLEGEKTEHPESNEDTHTAMEDKIKALQELSDEEVEKMLLESLEDTTALEDDSEEDDDEQ